MKKEIMFGGLISGHRVVVVNDLTLLIPSQQIEAVMRREISLAPNAPLSRMPGMSNLLCCTLSAGGEIKFTITAEELDAVIETYRKVH